MENSSSSPQKFARCHSVQTPPGSTTSVMGTRQLSSPNTYCSLVRSCCHLLHPHLPECVPATLKPLARSETTWSSASSGVCSIGRDRRIPLCKRSFLPRMVGTFQKERVL